MQDRLIVWLLATTGIVGLASLAVVGVHTFALFGLLHVPAVLMVLLLVRVAICLQRGQSPALRVGDRRILDGWSAIVVPVLVLTGWTALRETGVIGARLTTSASNDRVNTSWHSSSSTSGEGVVGGNVVVPVEFEGTGSFAITGDDGALFERFVTELRPVAAAFPGYRIQGRIAVEATAPFALVPLWKSATTEAHVKCDLFVLPVGSDECHGALRGTVDIEGSWSMWGFASQRDFHQLLGAHFGTAVRKPLVEQLKQLVGKLR